VAERAVEVAALAEDFGEPDHLEARGRLRRPPRRCHPRQTSSVRLLGLAQAPAGLLDLTLVEQDARGHLRAPG
jgi:hypothetical protein